MDKQKPERLWSIWERSRIACKNDKFFGKTETKDGTGKVVAAYIWVWKLAIGWYTPLNLEQASSIMQDAKAMVDQPTDSMTQPMPRSKP